eukprot:jgi/Mesen1/9095/ME000058S08591
MLAKDVHASGIDHTLGSMKGLHSYPLGGSFYPVQPYSITLLVGKPAKPYPLLIDTGSSLTWLLCSDSALSHDNDQGSKPFDDRASNSTLVDCDAKRSPSSLCGDAQRATYSFVGCYFPDSRGCLYSLTYADQTLTRGRLIQDDVSVRLASGALATVSAQFGCSVFTTDNFNYSLSGLLGLGRSQIALPSQMAASQKKLPNVFAHCLGGDKGGYFFFGKELVPRTGVAWAPLLPNYGILYTLRASAIYLNNSRLPLSPGAFKSNIGEFVFDSGTSFAYLQSGVYELFYDQLTRKPLSAEGKFQRVKYANGTTEAYAFNATAPGVTTLARSTSPDGSTCWSAPGVPLSQVTRFFPELKFHFGPKSSLNVGQDYLIQDSGKVCLAIVDFGFNYYHLIGDLLLRNHLLVYDNEKSRLGWVRKDCSKGPPP